MIPTKDQIESALKDPRTWEPNYQEWIGKRVRKARGRSSEPNLDREPKPFKSGLKENTVKGLTEHPVLGSPALTFVEDESVVECKRCHLCP